MANLSSYYEYWGKANPKLSISDTTCHLLPYHSLDVAAVGHVLLRESQSYISSFQKLTGMNALPLRKWITFFLALHDIGKFAESFQNLSPNILMRLQGRESDRVYYERHDSLGWVLWKECIRKRFQTMGIIPQASGSKRRRMSEHPVDVWMAAMVGHHGQPPKPISNRLLRDDFNAPSNLDSVTSFLNDLTPMLLGEDIVFPECNHDSIQLASWWLSGFAVLCDWLGSNTQFFPYQNTYEPIAVYWEKAKQRAAKAIQATELMGNTPSASLRLTDLIELQQGVKPVMTPLQQAVTNLNISESPQVFILEDVTGAGKTEAAVLLTHRLMSAGLGNSIYFALPTMATANTMYERMRNVYRKFFVQAAQPSLVLAHGASAMSDGFQQSIVGHYPEQQTEYIKQEQSAEAHCNAWLADNRKKALLADIGVGTVDQALLAILPSRHQSLRLLGLLNKILIVDEVHACDAYMHELLCALLRAHAVGGGSAILLSATLPHKQRASLLQAYADGKKWHSVSLQKTDDNSYPLISCLDSQGVTEQVIATRDSVKRKVSTVFLYDLKSIESLLAATIANEQCVCWIRNTVKDAVEAYQSLTDAHPEWNIDLFHARYALGDRIEIENRVVNRFSKNSDYTSRRGQVLIATQVVEQSLDLDFDTLISDLAPIDLLIQRAGRLRRHSRDRQGNRVAGDDQRGDVSLHVFSPKPTSSPTANWYAACFPSAQKVYEHHGQLWLTATLLHQKGEFRMPEDARMLIESVYGSDAQFDIPEGLQHQSNEAEGGRWANAGIARLNALKMEVGYSDESTNRWWDEAQTPTRLGDATTTVYIAKWQDDQLLPWSDEAKHAWQLSSLSIRTYWVAKEASTPDFSQDAIEAFKTEHLPAKGQWGVLLPLRQGTNGIWFGLVLNEKSESVQCAYSKQFGLVINFDSHKGEIV